MNRLIFLFIVSFGGICAAYRAPHFPVSVGKRLSQQLHVTKTANIAATVGVDGSLYRDTFTYTLKNDNDYEKLIKRVGILVDPKTKRFATCFADIQDMGTYVSRLDPLLVMQNTVNNLSTNRDNAARAVEQQVCF